MDGLELLASLFLPRRHAAVEDQLVDLIAVDRQGDGDAHVAGVEELAELLILAGQVEL